MKESDFRLPAQDGTPLFVRAFLPDQGTPRAIVQLAHGMAEHSARYARLARALCDRGIGLYADDHRGHGYTAPNRESLGHFADADGWEKVVGDQMLLTDEIKSRHPGVPMFLMGHSMGSYIVRGVAWRRAEPYKGLILSGTSHDHPVAYQSVRLVAAAEGLRQGKQGKSALLRKLTFDAFNAKIEDPRTSCDWLSRDPAEVDLYIADPLCGFSCSNQLWWDVLGGLAEICTPSNIERMPKSLPIYVLTGELDPTNSRLAGIRKLRKAYEAAGLQAVTVRVYQGARHELTNEINRDEVTHDLLEWLEAQLA